MNNPYEILARFWVAEDLGIEAILTNQSPYWYLQFQLPGSGPGRQRRKSLGTGNKKEAVIRGRRFAANFERGQIPAGQAREATLEKIINLRLEEMRQAGADADSLRLNKWYFAMLCKFAVQGTFASASILTPVFLTAFAARLRDEGISVRQAEPCKKPHKVRKCAPKTVREIVKSVRSLGKLAEHFLGRDPCRGYKLPRGESKEVETFSEAERAAIFADPRPGLSEIWQFFFMTGLRLEEFCWLTKDDVILNPQHQPVALHIRHKAINGKEWWPKHKRERIVSLVAEDALIVSKAMMASPGPWLFFAPDTWESTAGQWRGARIRSCLQQRLDACGIGHGTPHVFRHTCATFLANVAKMPLPLLQKFLGHRSLETTMRYLHARSDDVAAAMQGVDFKLTTATPTNPATNSGKDKESEGNHDQKRDAG